MRFFIMYNLITPTKSLTVISSIISILWFLLLTLVTSFFGVSLSLYSLGLWELFFLMFPFILAATFFICTFFLTLLEVIYRVANDKVVNLVDSNRQSQYFRKFLQSDESQTEEVNIGSIKRFNFYLSFLTINVTEGQVEIILPLPPRLESYNILKSSLSDIREVASIRMPSYTFQPAERGSFYFKIIGRKNYYKISQ